MRKNSFSAKTIKRFCISVVVTLAPGLLFSQNINTVAGNGVAATSGDGGPALMASFNHPGGVLKEYSGETYVVEYSGNVVRKIDLSGTVSTFAGNGFAGFGGDGGPATAASFHYPIDIKKDAIGNFYIVDNVNQRIRKIDTSGIISTYAGCGVIGYTGDGGPATNATLHDPNRIAFDLSGNLLIADADNNVIRKVDAVTNIITTVAGNGYAGFSGDGGPATAAELNVALGIGADQNGNLYIGDGGNSLIRKVDPSGIISTYAGTGIPGYSGDGGPATAASINYPNGVTVDKACNVYFTDWNGEVVRVIFTNGNIYTVVGTGVPGFYGDGGPATAAQIDGPNNLSFDQFMNLYIPEYYNNRVREVSNLGRDGACPPTEIKNTVYFADRYSMYPVPCNDNLNITSSVSCKKLNVRIISIKGETVFSKLFSDENKDFSLDLKNVATGTYDLILLDDVGNISSKKFTKE